MLVKVLGECRALEHLGVRDNYIGPDGVGRLAGALSCASALTTLDLRGNDIDDDGAGVLASVLGSCTALQSLDIGENGAFPTHADAVTCGGVDDQIDALVVVVVDMLMSLLSVFHLRVLPHPASLSILRFCSTPLAHSLTLKSACRHRCAGRGHAGAHAR
eukprot:547424-Rhodomonas_salina.1